VELFFDDGDQHVGGDGAPNSCLDCVLAIAQEFLDSQVLLDPLEEQCNLPSAFVRRGDCQRWQSRVVCQEDQRLTRLRVFDTVARSPHSRDP